MHETRRLSSRCRTYLDARAAWPHAIVMQPLLKRSDQIKPCSRTRCIRLATYLGAISRAAWCAEPRWDNIQTYVPVPVE
ncbi:hypothetical protein L596_003101 [Steinernema carpocapsae]|uniref:Uncharacterized protein n=1 Tax=Steinernema carpocapsae TaxID=34508 RepID=A0A4U8UVD6_STECR|nr:hypothetical protein L596_003101 [Steinernema carpocapsae]